MGQDLIKHWKNPMSRTSLGANNLPQHPAGDVMSELSDAELNNVMGAGEMNAAAKSGGNVCTYSVECDFCPTRNCTGIPWFGC
ncbi:MULTISPECIES: plantaricin C family lantibiotic [Priestia]|uniref:plantaricin C family lantibiotic n=1 Tax=Priestia TaxID=2800373 RepID=UPI00196A82CA|nr:MULTISPECIES: plantaricin C family lantibiotic [Priestia]MCE4093084.1 plantaricin C family lantibiotic [Priestia megaterium]MED3821538.1 plantaricin C family lantibiotic [Priestia aryabhattai]QSF42326.1 plantaricin C family lantibiotic [Priestia megaterium]